MDKPPVDDKTLAAAAISLRRLRRECAQTDRRLAALRERVRALILLLREELGDDIPF